MSYSIEVTVRHGSTNFKALAVNLRDLLTTVIDALDSRADLREMPYQERDKLYTKFLEQTFSVWTGEQRTYTDKDIEIHNWTPIDVQEHGGIYEWEARNE